MKILAIDTATKFLSLGIYIDGAFYEYNLELGRRLSPLITVTIKRSLDALGLEPADMDYFACGLGPGSFTGLRVGLSTMQGLSWALAKPLIGVPTLDILALNAKGRANKAIVTALDAKRGLIYSCFYRNTGAALRKISPYLLLSPEGLARKIAPRSAILGDALDPYRETILKSVRGADLLDRDSWYPKPRNIITLALERVKDKKRPALSKIMPIYIYPKECQIKNV
ncbi:MAG: tRNA (adenosine(37)-N6)-threonylcarbamoyltransferase complex dimerization subunit type 1 TsaB [Candidatus Omnitrophota bacterium]